MEKNFLILVPCLHLQIPDHDRLHSMGRYSPNVSRGSPRRSLTTIQAGNLQGRLAFPPSLILLLTSKDDADDKGGTLKEVVRDYPCLGVSRISLLNRRHTVYLFQKRIKDKRLMINTLRAESGYTPMRRSGLAVVEVVGSISESGKRIPSRGKENERLAGSQPRPSGIYFFGSCMRLAVFVYRSGESRNIPSEPCSALLVFWHNVSPSWTPQLSGLLPY
jgi:hypothetical protein